METIGHPEMSKIAWSLLPGKLFTETEVVDNSKASKRFEQSESFIQPMARKNYVVF